MGWQIALYMNFLTAELRVKPKQKSINQSKVSVAEQLLSDTAP